MTDEILPRSDRIVLLETLRTELMEKIKRIDNANCFDGERESYRIEILKISHQRAKEVVLMGLDEALQELGRQIQEVQSQNEILERGAQEQEEILKAAMNFYGQMTIFLESKKKKSLHASSQLGSRHRGTRYTEEDIQRWIEKRREGKLVSQIAKEENVRVKTVRARLRQKGVITSQGMDRLIGSEE